MIWSCWSVGYKGKITKPIFPTRKVNWLVST